MNMLKVYWIGLWIKERPKVEKTIKKCNINVITKVRAILEARYIMKAGCCNFINSNAINCFVVWDKTPSGSNF